MASGSWAAGADRPDDHRVLHLHHVRREGVVEHLEVRGLAALTTPLLARSALVRISALSAVLGALVAPAQPPKAWAAAATISS